MRLFFILVFLSSLVFAQISYDKLVKIAKETNLELFGTYKIPKMDFNETKNVNKEKQNKYIPLTIERSSRTKRLLIYKLPYLSFNGVVKKVIGITGELSESVCEATLKGEDIIEPCIDVKNFIKKRNALLDEFVKNLYAFKKDTEENGAYYGGVFSCSLLYKYYTFGHYEDCEKLMNMLSSKEKENLFKYANFLLLH